MLEVQRAQDHCGANVVTVTIPPGSVREKSSCLGDREPRDNPRFVVTNLRQTPRFIYEKVYCARGDIDATVATSTPGSTSRPTTAFASPVEPHRLPAERSPANCRGDRRRRSR